MSRPLNTPDGSQRIIAPTTTTKFALRMLAASKAAHDNMPQGFYPGPALDILCMMHISEERATYLRLSDFAICEGAKGSIGKRWLNALVEHRLVEQMDDLYALSCHGYDLITRVIEAMFEAQRALD